MIDMIKYVVPYPYEAYNTSNRQYYNNNFSKFKNTIYGWVKKNILVPNDDLHRTDILDRLDRAFELMEKTDINSQIKEWLIKHIDKLEFIFDFSGLAFGINFWEEMERIGVVCPQYIDEVDQPLYPNYNESVFVKNMGIIDKLEWMYENCEFIPFRIIYENISDDGSSHKFSHIKRDEHVMKRLKDYLDGLKYQPNDNVFYYIEFNPKKCSYYLKRDLSRSPK